MGLPSALANNHSEALLPQRWNGSCGNREAPLV
jgi:hypothetical protein